MEIEKINLKVNIDEFMNFNLKLPMEMNLNEFKEVLIKCKDLFKCFNTDSEARQIRPVRESQPTIKKHNKHRIKLSQEDKKYIIKNYNPKIKNYCVGIAQHLGTTNQQIHYEILKLREAGLLPRNEEYLLRYKNANHIKKFLEKREQDKNSNGGIN
jgi:hypothetical protein